MKKSNHIFLVISFISGFIFATVCTLWGGYEIGIAISNLLTIDSFIAKSAIIIVMIAIIATPVYSIWLYGGIISIYLIESIEILYQKKIKKMR